MPPKTVVMDSSRHIHLMHLIGLSADNLKDIHEMFQSTLTAICGHLRWPVGFAYIVEAPGRLYGISAAYSSNADQYENFRFATAGIDFSAKASLIGQVLRSGKTCFMDDVQSEEHFLRKDEARKANLTSCLAIPILVHNRVAAIMEFFHTETIKPQDTELEMIDVIAAHLGLVIEQRRTEKKLHGLFDSAPDAQIVTDVSGEIVMANKQTEALFGYPKDQLIGQPMEILVPPELRTDHIKHRQRYIASPHPRPMGIGMELTALRRDGTAFPVEVSLSPIELEDGLFIATAIRDVRERKNLEAQLRQKERLVEMGRMAAIFAHEAADPLTAISLQTELMEETFPAKYQNRITDLRREISRLGSLLNEFRSFSRLEELQLARVDFTIVVQNVVRKNREAWEKSGIRVITESGEDLVLQADSEKLQQVVINLCRNAVQSMPEGGTLTLITYGTEENIVLEVNDTGSGIPEGIDIFKPFITTKLQGNGLGLYVVQRIVSAHKGTVGFSSNHGRGTTFQINLPRKLRSLQKSSDARL